MSNKFLSNSTGTIADGTENIYGSYVGASNLNPGSTVKVDGLKRLVSSEILISDITGLSSSIASKLSNPSTRPITAPSFIKSGGLSTQYLMADGSVTISSGSSGNSSNIYLYNSNTTLTPPPGVGQIRYNNAVQDNATEIYISHLTRDNLDIDEFLNLINDLSIIYIQDQNTSSNFIKYTVTTTPTIVVNDYITIPVLKQSSDGTGSTNFPNGHNIFMSVFTNQTTIDNRITTVEGKTQNQTAIANETTFIGDVKATNFIIPTGLPTELLYADGSYNSNIYNKLYSDKIGIGQGSGGITQSDFTTAIGTGCGVTNQGRGSTALGFLCGVNDQKERATAIGMQSGYNNQGEGAISIGFLCAHDNQGNYSVSIGTNIGTNQAANSVVISGGESGLGNSAYQTVEGFFMHPVRNVNSQTTNVLTYDPATKEMTYNGLIDLTDITNATHSNIPSTIVKRDSIGNFSVGAITATSINTGGNSKQILLANGTVDNKIFQMIKKSWDVVPITISNGAMTGNSWDYYINEQVPYDMYISKIRVNFSLTGSDISRFAIYRGNDLTAVLVGQTPQLTAISITQPYTTLTFTAETGQNMYFTKDENIVVAYASSGTTTRISTVSLSTGNNLIGWYNTTESVNGFSVNPKGKAGASIGAFCCRLISVDVLP